MDMTQTLLEQSVYSENQNPEGGIEKEEIGIVRLVAVAGWKTVRFLKDKEDV